MIIDLEQEFDFTHKALNGFDDGHKLRTKYKLDEADKGTESVTVIFPHYVWNVSDSFFRGLFKESYRKLGKETFATRYIFDSENHLTSILSCCLVNLHELLHAPKRPEPDDEDEWQW